MRVLFLNVVDNRKPVHTRYYPLAFGYLVSYCNKHNEPFEHAYSENSNPSILKSVRPDVVAMTCITENYNLAKHYAQISKHFSETIKIIIGGVHISAVPHSLTGDMDIGVKFETEETFLELVKNDWSLTVTLKV